MQRSGVAHPRVDPSTFLARSLAAASTPSSRPPRRSSRSACSTAAHCRGAGEAQATIATLAERDRTDSRRPWSAPWPTHTALPIAPSTRCPRDARCAHRIDEMPLRAAFQNATVVVVPLVVDQSHSVGALAYERLALELAAGTVGATSRCCPVDPEPRRPRRPRLQPAHRTHPATSRAGRRGRRDQAAENADQGVASPGARRLRCGARSCSPDTRRRRVRRRLRARRPLIEPASRGLARGATLRPPTCCRHPSRPGASAGGPQSHLPRRERSPGASVRAERLAGVRSTALRAGTQGHAVAPRHGGRRPPRRRWPRPGPGRPLRAQARRVSVAARVRAPIGHTACRL